jgi:hypothetical protein
MPDRDVERVAAAIYGQTWVATETGPDAPTWDKIAGDQRAERYRMMARAAIAAMEKDD